MYYLKGFHLRNRNEEYLHTMIMGLPDPGKTIVAKIICKLYQTMGILSDTGPFKIAYRDDFIAGYSGKQQSKHENSCIGGVLFVDEVYSLAPGQQSERDIFSKECIETIVLGIG